MPLAKMDTSSFDEIVIRTENVERFICMRSNGHIQSSVLRAMYDGDDRLTPFDVSLYGSLSTGSTAADLRPIRAHKSVLAFASKHLYDLFTSDGYIDSHQSEYRVEAVEHESLRQIVTFVYKDEMKIDSENAVDVVCGILVAADYLVMKNLVVACERFLAGDQQVTAENCVKLWCLARKLSCFTLMHASSIKIAKHLKDMPQYAEFLSMPHDDFAKLIMSEALVTAAADVRCLAAIAWLKYESVKRASFASDVVNMVPLTFGSVSLDTIHEALACEVLREHAPETELKLSAGMLKRTKLVESFAVAGRDEPSKSCWYLMDGEEMLQQFIKYDIGRGSWSSLPCLPWQRERFGACAVGNRIVVMGGTKHFREGTKNVHFSSDIEEYDVSSGLWSVSSAKLLITSSQAAAVSDGQHAAYVLGDDYQEECQMYNCATKQVTKIADSLSTRFLGAAAVKIYGNNSCIYVVGDRCYPDLNSSIEKYDIVNNRWSEAGKLLTGIRCLPAATIAGDDLYLMGGGVDDKWSNTVEAFNTRTGQSRTVPHLLETCRGFHATTVYNDYVVCAVGGRSIVDGRKLSTVEAYDTREGKWTTGIIIPDMPVATSYFGFAAV